jgi:hypothetical protein
VRELMKSVGSYVGLLLLFVRKETVWYFVSNIHCHATFKLALWRNGISYDSLQFDFSYRGLLSWLYWKVRSFSDIVPTMGSGRQLYIDDGVLCNRSPLSHAGGGSLISMSKDNANQTLWTAMTLLSMLWLYYFLLLILLVAARVIESGLLL